MKWGVFFVHEKKELVVMGRDSWRLDSQIHLGNPEWLCSWSQGLCLSQSSLVRATSDALDPAASQENRLDLGQQLVPSTLFSYRV